MPGVVAPGLAQSPQRLLGGNLVTGKDGIEIPCQLAVNLRKVFEGRPLCLVDEVIE